jgi:hypothetical protein
MQNNPPGSAVLVHYVKRFFLLTYALWLTGLRVGAENIDAAGALPGALVELRCGAATLQLNAHGDTHLLVGNDRSAFSALSELSGMEATGKLAADLGKPGVATFTRVMRTIGGSDSCTVKDRFAVDGDAIRWDVTVAGISSPFGADVTSTVVAPTMQDPSYWTTWGGLKSDAEVKTLLGANGSMWDDPLQFLKLNDRKFEFGGQSHTERDACSIPVFVVGSTATQQAIMLAHGIDTPIVNMHVQVSRDGAFIFVRKNRRIEKGRPFAYSIFIRPQPLDWRTALGWYRDKYRNFFVPKSQATWMVAGNGAYSEHEGDLDAYQLHQSGLQFNWKAGYDYLYMGMFLPYTKDLDFKWTNARFQGAEAPAFATSLRNMAAYSKKMRGYGFHVLNYMNPAELGLKIAPFAAPPTRKAVRDEDLWRDANDFVFYKLRDAVLFPKDAAEPYQAWEQSVLMDVGVPSYQNHLIAQSKMHIEGLPDSSGVCFDRTDYLRFFNWKRDDGQSWVSGAPCGSLAFGWVDFMKKIGPLFHDKDKVIYCNPLYRRCDLYENIDGYYDEFGFANAASLSISSFLALDKPYVGWTWGLPTDMPLDEYFQRYLYLGGYMTAPVPFNNHTIKPGDAKADQMFVDYGLLFESLRFRRWNLEESPIAVEGAKANCFEIPGGLLIPVVFGSDRPTATVKVRSKNPVMTGPQFVEVLHPGDSEWQTLQDHPLRTGDTIQVPLKNGCAMVRIVHTKILPSAKAFIKSARISVVSALPGAKVFKREMTDRKWTGDSELLAALDITKNTHLQFALRDATGKPVPQGIFENEWVRCLPPTPTVIPDKGMVFREKKVEINIPKWAANGVVHFTLDGTEPTEQSPVYAGAITLTKACHIMARLYLNGETGGIASAQFQDVPPPPRLPDVYISELPALKETVGVPNTTIQRNLAWSKAPLSLLGKTYTNGIGVCAVSDLVFEAKPSYQRFVAFVGIDDAMKDFPAANVKFQVYGDVRDGSLAADAIAGETLLYESDVMRPNMAAGVDVAIPSGIKRIRLHVTDEGSIDGDHANWVNAGFVTHP